MLLLLPRSCWHRRPRCNTRAHLCLPCIMLNGYLPLSLQRGPFKEGIGRAEGIIAVMTAEERRTPALLISDATSQMRLRRIAKDAGVKISAVSVSVCSFILL